MEQSAPHPWPSLQRPFWTDLDGEWDFRPDPADQGLTHRWYVDDGPWDQTIVVPFGWETAASGVGTNWLPVGWYRRRVPIPAAAESDRHFFLVFGSVHHKATVWVDGRQLADHRGGSSRFDCDLTSSLPQHTDTGGNTVTVVVRVEAPIDKRWIPHGKQRSVPNDDFDPCSFRPTSGIWQSVWLEERPVAHITALQLRPAADLSGIDVLVRCAGPADEPSTIAVSTEGVTVEVEPVDGMARLTLPIRQPRLWSPADPQLYAVTAELRSSGGTDTVSSQTGLRSIEVSADRLLLNGNQVYVRGVLDQGYWPDSGLTAPDEQALADDLALARAAGYTLVRKHLKFENPLQVAMADRLGMMLWIEPPSFGRYSAAAVQEFRDQIPEMVSRYGNHPSVVIWGLYNEEWGLEWQVAEQPERAEVLADAYQLVHSLDATRVIIDNSGWTHVRSDLLDWHVYTGDLKRWSDILTELADGSRTSLDIGVAEGAVVARPLHVRPASVTSLPPLLNSEYGVGLTSLERAWHLKWQTLIMRRHDRNHGYIYCELTDIEHETAGIYTDHRAVKDFGSVLPAEVNADTVIIPLLWPVQPGVDIPLAADTTTPLEFEVAISHQGPQSLNARLHWGWRDLGQGGPLGDVSAEPFHCTDPVGIQIPVPKLGGSLSTAVLELTLVDDNDDVVARTTIDVGRADRLTPG